MTPEAVIFMDDLKRERVYQIDYKKRKYRVQYGESDFAFISRMLEDVGISFYFEASVDSSRSISSHQATGDLLLPIVSPRLPSPPTPSPVEDRTVGSLLC